MTVLVQHWDAFTLQPGKGNPAGIVLATQGLSGADMQSIAKIIGFNDTAFILPSQSADLRIRYFAPRREVDLCGHATIAAFAALLREKLLPRDGCDGHFTLETKSGILPISIDLTKSDAPQIVMTQGAAHFSAFTGSRAALAHAIGIAVSDFHATLPILYGSTGRRTLVVPVRDLNTMQRMAPLPHEFETILDMPSASIHPFCLETIDKRASMHARHFSSPTSGTLEDAVTGTASGVLGAYYRQFIADHDVVEPLLIEQGYEVEREGTVKVWAQRQGDNYNVRIAGTACFVRDIEITQA